MLVTDKKRTQPAGYAGALLRVDLTTGGRGEQASDEDVARTYGGGTAIGAKVRCDEGGAGGQCS